VIFRKKGEAGVGNRGCKYHTLGVYRYRKLKNTRFPESNIKT
jgi:hypothetical protein